MEILASELRQLQSLVAFLKRWPNSCCFTFVCAKLPYRKRREGRRVWKHSGSCMQGKTHGSFQPGLCDLVLAWIMEMKASHPACLLVIGKKPTRGKAGQWCECCQGDHPGYTVGPHQLWVISYSSHQCRKLQGGCCLMWMPFCGPGWKPGLLQPLLWACSASPSLRGCACSWSRRCSRSLEGHKKTVSQSRVPAELK